MGPAATKALIEFCKLTYLISITISQTHNTLRPQKRTCTKMEPKQLSNFSFSQVAPFENLEMLDQDFREITSVKCVVFVFDDNYPFFFCLLLHCYKIKVFQFWWKTIGDFFDVGDL